MKPASAAAPIPPAALDELSAISNELKTDGAGEPAAPDAPQPEAAAASPSPAPAADPDLAPITPEQAQDMAGQVWGFAFDSTEQMLPVFKFHDQTRAKAIAKTVPVILKHQDKLPWWYKKWREEIDLGMFVGALVVTCIKGYILAKRAAEEASATRTVAPPAQAQAAPAANPTDPEPGRTAA